MKCVIEERGELVNWNVHLNKVTSLFQNKGARKAKPFMVTRENIKPTNKVVFQ